MAGADYEEQSGELVFEMGVTKRQIQIEITDDGTYEKEEQVESSTCCSRLTTHYSLLTTHDSRLTTHDSRLTTHDSRLTTYDLRRTPHYAQVPLRRRGAARLRLRPACHPRRRQPPALLTPTLAPTLTPQP